MIEKETHMGGEVWDPKISFEDLSSLEGSMESVATLEPRHGLRHLPHPAVYSGSSEYCSERKKGN